MDKKWRLLLSLALSPSLSLSPTHPFKKRGKPTRLALFLSPLVYLCFVLFLIILRYVWPSQVSIVIFCFLLLLLFFLHLFRVIIWFTSKKNTTYYLYMYLYYYYYYYFALTLRFFSHFFYALFFVLFLKSEI